MAAEQIAEFFGTLGFKINKADIKAVDATLDHIEKKARQVVEHSLSNMKVQITGFRFSGDFNARLYKSMQKKLRTLNNKKGLSPEIKVHKFDVDRNALLREMESAVRYVEQNLRINLRTGVERPNVGGTRGGAGGPRGGISRFGTGMGVGAAAGSFGRGFIPGLGLAFGVNQLNQINQELMGQQYAAQAVFGSKDSGSQGLEWLRGFSNEVGIDYRKQGQPYLRMIASATNAGMSVGSTQELFAGISRYGRTMGLGSEDMKGSLRAVEQMLNKQQVYSEELKTQLAEKMPGVISAMAEAVTGDAANTKELFKLMEAGEVSATEYLPKFAEILEARAMEGGAYFEAIKSSAAEQARFNNSFNDMVKVFSRAGFEEGQAGIFRTMRDFLSGMTPLITAFGEAWSYVGDVIRVPLGLMYDLGKGIEGLAEITGISKGALVGLGTVFAALAFPLTRTVTMVYGLFMLLEDFTAFLTGRGSLIGRLLGDEAEGVRENFLSLFESVISTGQQLFSVVESIIGLFSRTDLPLIGALNAFLQHAEATFELINALLGGKSKEEREAERARKLTADGTNPALAGMPAGANAAPKEKSWIQGVGNGVGTYIEKNPFMFVPRALSLDRLARYAVSDEETADLAGINARARMSMVNQGFSSQTNNATSQAVTQNVNVSLPEGTSQEMAEEMLTILQDMLKGVDRGGYSE